MKINDDMLFAHPILSAASNDYPELDFHADFKIQCDDDLLVIEASLDPQCPDIRKLIERGRAGCGYFLICRRTYQFRLLEAGVGASSIDANAADFFGVIQLRPVVWSKTEILKWTSPALHSEYDAPVDIPACRLIAVGQEYRFTIDRKQLRPFESIFVLTETKEQEPGSISVDLDEDKVRICVHPTTKKNIDDIRNEAFGRDILLNALYQPAIMHILHELAHGSRDFGDRKWYRVFHAKCLANGVSLPGGEPLRDAQKLLRKPFSRIESARTDIFK